jgi:hypothetical protein
MANETFIDKIFRVAQENPDELEQILMSERQRIYDRSTPAQLAKLKGLQFRMDLIRQRWGDNHTQAYIAMGEEMMPKFRALDKELQLQKETLVAASQSMKQCTAPPQNEQSTNIVEKKKPTLTLYK